VEVHVALLEVLEHHAPERVVGQNLLVRNEHRLFKRSCPPAQHTHNTHTNHAPPHAR
jgi:hypothetical protein